MCDLWLFNNMFLIHVLFTCLSVHLPTSLHLFPSCLPLCLSTCLSVYLFTCLSAHLIYSTCLVYGKKTTYLPALLLIFLSDYMYQPVQLSTCSPFYLTACLPVCQFISLSVSIHMTSFLLFYLIICVPSV